MSHAPYSNQVQRRHNGVAAKRPQQRRKPEASNCHDLHAVCSDIAWVLRHRFKGAFVYARNKADAVSQLARKMRRYTRTVIHKALSLMIERGRIAESEWGYALKA